MTITIDLKPELEARLKHSAEQAGLTPEQYLVGCIELAPAVLPIEKLAEQIRQSRIFETSEMLPAEELAKLIVQSQETLEEPAGTVGVVPPIQDLDELFAQWREEDATDDPEELARRDAQLDELKANLNANRAATGGRLLFP